MRKEPALQHREQGRPLEESATARCGRSLGMRPAVVRLDYGVGEAAVVEVGPTGRPVGRGGGLVEVCLHLHLAG
jgi:hypothetical protein